MAFSLWCSWLRRQVVRDVKLTVKTFTQNEESYPVDMKRVAAAGTFAECDQNGGVHKEDKPDYEYGSHCPVGWRD